MNPEEPMPETAPGPTLAEVVIPLLKGVVYQDNDASLWAKLLRFEARARDYVAVLDLELELDEAEGYAFLRSREPEEGEPSPASPRLYARRPLSFPVSLLLALLRKKLTEFDASGSEARLVLTRDEIAETLRVFLPTETNDARLSDRIESHLNKIVELGFIRKLKSPSSGNQAPSYEVSRILKAFVDAQWLAEFDARLAEYRDHAAALEEEPNGD